MKAVAFFSDRAMLPGLHVTLSSLLRALPADAPDVDLHVFLDRVTAQEKQLLRSTHQQNPCGTKLVLHDYSPISPAGGNSLHGNLMAYGRIYLAQLLPEYEHCVYLDCDLFVNRSVLDMFDCFDDEALSLVDGTGRRGDSLDKNLYALAGLDQEGPCFNSGVMGMNLRLWRDGAIAHSIVEVARKYAGKFNSADQALLNVALCDRFKCLGGSWNTALYPSTVRVEKREARIYHFVGSPKPWDVFGRHLVTNFAMWHEEYLTTAVAGRSALRYASLKRSARISRQYFKALLA
jgi:lipopolysaccharide biosynthesis glycosyltransferase